MIRRPGEEVIDFNNSFFARWGGERLNLHGQEWRTKNGFVHHGFCHASSVVIIDELAHTGSGILGGPIRDDVGRRDRVDCYKICGSHFSNHQCCGALGQSFFQQVRM